MSVIIGIDPHKSTHTAVAIDQVEQPLARVQLVADRCQVQRLLVLAEPLGTQRSWAVESAGGLGKLLAQQLVEAGELVVDVPPALAARVRLLGWTKAGDITSRMAELVREVRTVTEQLEPERAVRVATRSSCAA